MPVLSRRRLVAIIFAALVVAALVPVAVIGWRERQVELARQRFVDRVLDEARHEGSASAYGPTTITMTSASLRTVLSLIAAYNEVALVTSLVSEKADVSRAVHEIPAMHALDLYAIDGGYFIRIEGATGVVERLEREDDPIALARAADALRALARRTKRARSLWLAIEIKRRGILDHLDEGVMRPLHEEFDRAR